MSHENSEMQPRITQEQAGAFAMVEKAKQRYLNTCPLLVGYLYETTIPLALVATLLNPDIPEEHLHVEAQALGEAAREVLSIEVYEEALYRRRAFHAEVPQSAIIPEEAKERFEETRERIGTEIMVVSRGHRPWTKKEVALTMWWIENDEECRDEQGRIRRNLIAERLNELHKDKNDGLKPRTGESVGNLYKQVRKGVKRGQHISPKDPTYLQKYLEEAGEVFLDIEENQGKSEE